MAACTIDFRNLDEGFGGKTYKRKRETNTLIHPAENDMDLDQEPSQPAKRAAHTSPSDPNKPIFGRPTYDGVIAGRVSGRNWKQPRKRRSSAVAVTRTSLTLEQCNRERELKKAYKERKEELKEEIRKNKSEKRRLKEERDKKKKENVLRTGTKLQKVTNPKTLKKIAKSKQRKQLRVVADDLLNNKNNNKNN